MFMCIIIYGMRQREVCIIYLTCMWIQSDLLHGGELESRGSVTPAPHQSAGTRNALHKIAINITTRCHFRALDAYNEFGELTALPRPSSWINLGQLCDQREESNSPLQMSGHSPGIPCSVNWPIQSWVNKLRTDFGEIFCSGWSWPNEEPVRLWWQSRSSEVPRSQYRMLYHYEPGHTLTLCSVSRQTMNEFRWKFTAGCRVAQGAASQILAAFWFGIGIQGSWIIRIRIMYTRLLYWVRSVR